MSVLMMMGTTWSAAMVWGLVQFYIVRTSSYAPVSARGRMLYVTGVQSDMVKVDSDGRKVPTGGRWMDGLGVPFVRQVFEELKTVEEVAVMSGGTGQVRLRLPDGRRAVSLHSGRRMVTFGVCSTLCSWPASRMMKRVFGVLDGRLC